jgi:hypothetical protein
MWADVWLRGSLQSGGRIHMDMRTSPTVVRLVARRSRSCGVAGDLGLRCALLRRSVWCIWAMSTRVGATNR